ncbi:MAG: hypothetical protein ACJAY8_000637 [Sphingobacteriales bacterium]|jgi:uncharacterized protein (DUF1778 family)
MEATIESKGKTRFDTRLPIEQKELFERAATLSGYKSLSEFVLSTVQQRAQQIIKENELIIASERDSEIFFDSLVNPKAPNDALLNAAKKYNETRK